MPRSAAVFDGRNDFAEVMKKAYSWTVRNRSIQNQCKGLSAGFAKERQERSPPRCLRQNRRLSLPLGDQNEETSVLFTKERG